MGGPSAPSFSPLHALKASPPYKSQQLTRRRGDAEFRASACAKRARVRLTSTRAMSQGPKCASTRLCKGTRTQRQPQGQGCKRASALVRASGLAHQPATQLCKGARRRFGEHMRRRRCERASARLRASSQVCANKRASVNAPSCASTPFCKCAMVQAYKRASVQLCKFISMPARSCGCSIAPPPPPPCVSQPLEGFRGWSPTGFVPAASQQGVPQVAPFPVPG